MDIMKNFKRLHVYLSPEDIEYLNTIAKKIDGTKTQALRTIIKRDKKAQNIYNK